jgi:hypothetical protein
MATSMHQLADGNVSIELLADANNHRCTWFEIPGGGSMKFLPNFLGRVHLFGVLLHFLEGGYTLNPLTPPPCASMPTNGYQWLAHGNQCYGW